MKLAGLVIIIAIGLPHLGSVNYWEMPHGYSGLFAASALIFFAYQGFESMVKFSEETKKPETTVPKALILALAISVILYVLVALSVVSVTGVAAAGGFKAPFADIVSGTLGPGCCGNDRNCRPLCHREYRTDVHVRIVQNSLRYGGFVSLTAVLAWVHPGGEHPWIAIIICGVLSCILLFAGDIAFIANVTNFTLFITFIVINAAVIVLRYRFPGYSTGLSVSLLSLAGYPLIPVAGIVFCIFLLAVRIYRCLSWSSAHGSRSSTHGYCRTSQSGKKSLTKLSDSFNEQKCLTGYPDTIPEITGIHYGKKIPDIYLAVCHRSGFCFRALDSDRYRSTGGASHCTGDVVDALYSDPVVRWIFFILPADHPCQSPFMEHTGKEDFPGLFP